MLLRRPIVLRTTYGIAAEQNRRLDGNAEVTLTLFTSHAPVASTCRIVVNVSSFWGCVHGTVTG